MYYESDPRSMQWIDDALGHSARRIRIDAVNLLGVVDSALRKQWLRRALRDPDPVVVATAAFVETFATGTSAHRFDLFESDFGSGLVAGDLRWEWEYSIAVCDGFVFPGALTHVWTAHEDDIAARRLAIMKTYVGKMDQAVRATALIVDKRLVTKHTRLPRSRAEAHQWHLRGRPRYHEP